MMFFGISITAIDIAIGLCFTIPTDIFVAIFILWLTGRKHSMLKKMGLRDGTELNIVTYKAGIPILNISMIGNSIWDAVKNGFSDMIGGKAKHPLNTTTSDTLKEAVHSGLSEIMAEEVKGIFQDPEFRKSVKDKIGNKAKSIVDAAISDELNDTKK